MYPAAVYIERWLNFHHFSNNKIPQSNQFRLTFLLLLLLLLITVQNLYSIKALVKINYIDNVDKFVI